MEFEVEKNPFTNHMENKDVSMLLKVPFNDDLEPPLGVGSSGMPMPDPSSINT